MQIKQFGLIMQLVILLMLDKYVIFLKVVNHYATFSYDFRSNHFGAVVEVYYKEVNESMLSSSTN